MSARFLHPVTAGWHATVPSVGGPNYDEFVDDRAAAAAIAARPNSVVALDLPELTAQARQRGLDLAASLPLAAKHLAAMKKAGLYAPVTDALFAYEMREIDGHVARGLLGLVHAEEFSDCAEQPGRILRNEDVSQVKVEERRQHIDALRHLLSAVLVVPAQDQEKYNEELTGAIDALTTPPVITEIDDRGTSHSLWLLPDGSADRFRPILDDNRFLVADGNHRSRAAQQSISPWCMVVVAAPSGLRIEPYSRLLHTPALGAQTIRERIEEAGIEVAGAPALGPDDEYSENYLYLSGGSWYRLDLSTPVGDRAVDALPHSVVEQRIFQQALHLRPSASEIRYVGGRSAHDYLVSQVDSGAAVAALVLRPVSMTEFTDVNAARDHMPRKSTWFMPKARAGLVIARTV